MEDAAKQMSEGNEIWFSEELHLNVEAFTSENAQALASDTGEEIFQVFSLVHEDDRVAFLKKLPQEAITKLRAYATELKATRESQSAESSDTDAEQE